MEINHYDHTSEPSSFSWTWIDILRITLGIAFVFLLGITLLQLVQRVGEDGLDLEGNAAIYLNAGLGALEGIAIIGGVYFLGLRRRRLPWSAAGIRPISQSWVMGAIIAGIVVIPLSGMIAGGVQILLGRPLENPQLPFLAPEGFSWFGAVSMFILGGIVAPFAEELYFRGVLYQWLRNRWGVGAGIAISSLIFGAVHVEISVAVAAAVLGAVLAWVYERSQSLWPAVIVHALNNSVKIALLYVMLAGGQLPISG